MRPMPRFRLTIEYDGGPFVGWQRQANGLGVQEVLEKAVERFAGARAAVVGAGRTDAGVHALGQVAHFDMVREMDPERVRNAINFHVRPHPVAVLEASIAPADFHARFSARLRTYRYRILNRRPPPVLERGRAWWVTVPLDAAAMAEAARVLEGRHDFSSFRASLCQARSAVKTLDRLIVRRDGESIAIEAVARSFLHHQVRNMVGTLALVGEGKWTPDQVAAALTARRREAAGPTAPPEGLYFVAVDY